MTKMRYILLIVLILAVAIVSFVLFKTELQHNPPANKQTSYSENIPCTVNENCTNGLSCSTISWTCVDDATYQQEHINQIEKESQTYANILHSGLQNLSQALQNGLPSDCSRLKADGNVKNAGNQPIILVPGQKTCFILMALKLKDPLICEYLNTTSELVSFDALPDIRGYPNLTEYSQLLAYSSAVIARGKARDCLNIIGNTTQP